MVFDDTKPSYDSQDWSRHHPDAKGGKPENMPEPQGKSVMMSCFVDADHAGCQLTHRLHTGVILYIIGRQSFGIPSGRTLWNHPHLAWSLLP
jgi:hypothetical protein